MLNDPKYDIKDGRLWHRQGKYFVPDEEPIIILRGKDPCAVNLLHMMHLAGYDLPHLQSLKERLDAFMAYQAKYPARTRQGCHMHKDGE